MIVTDIKFYLDGGTFEIHTNEGVYFIDKMLGSQTNNEILDKHPSNKNAKIITTTKLYAELISALYYYDSNADRIYDCTWEGRAKASEALLHTWQIWNGIWREHALQYESVVRENMPELIGPTKEIIIKNLIKDKFLKKENTVYKDMDIDEWAKK